MRTALSANNGERKRFRAVFVRTGKKTDYKGYSIDTLLLRDVIDLSNEAVVTDHVWFTFTKGFDLAGIREGDTVEFDARIKAYKKGYVNKAMGLSRQKTDYKLSHPTKIAIIKK